MQQKKIKLLMASLFVLVVASRAIAQGAYVPGQPVIPPPPPGTRTLEDNAKYIFQPTKADLNLSDEQYAVLVPMFARVEKASVEFWVEPPGQFPKDEKGKTQFPPYTATLMDSVRFLEISLINLQKALDDGLPPEALRTRLLAIAQARQRANADFQPGVDELMKHLDKRQEAVVVSMGLQGFLYPDRLNQQMFTLSRIEGIIGQLGLTDEKSKAEVREKLRRIGADVFALSMPLRIVQYRQPNDPVQPLDPVIKNLVDSNAGLVKVLKDKNAAVGDISTSLETYRKARADVDEQLTATEKELASMFPLRQQSILVANGMLEMGAASN